MYATIITPLQGFLCCLLYPTANYRLIPPLQGLAEYIIPNRAGLRPALNLFHPFRVKLA